MLVTATTVDARTLFERARQILAGNQEPTPDQAVDMRFGIERALRLVRKLPAIPPSLETAAARAVSTVEGTLVAIDTIQEHLDEALELTAEAFQTDDASKRAMIADRYEQLRAQIDAVAAGASFEGVNLIDASRDAIEIRLREPGLRRHSINHITLVAGERGLSLKSPADLFLSDDEIDATRQTLLAARQRLDRAVDTFLNQATMLAPHLNSPQEV
jgi:hypothetical protein